MAITISGSGITSANIADDTIVNSDINSSAAIAQSKTASLVGGDLPTGSVLQVVQGAFESSGMSTSSTGQVASGYTTSITPTTSGNKVLVLLRGQVKSPNSSARWGAVQIKDTTNNTFSDNVQTLARGVNEEDFTVWHIFTTTSTASHTYEMYQGSCDDQTKYYKTMNFLLMEIAQ